MNTSNKSVGVDLKQTRDVLERWSYEVIKPLSAPEKDFIKEFCLRSVSMNPLQWMSLICPIPEEVQYIISSDLNVIYEIVSKYGNKRDEYSDWPLIFLLWSIIDVRRDMFDIIMDNFPYIMGNINNDLLRNIMFSSRSLNKLSYFSDRFKKIIKEPIPLVNLMQLRNVAQVSMVMDVMHIDKYLTSMQFNLQFDNTPEPVLDYLIDCGLIRKKFLQNIAMDYCTPSSTNTTQFWWFVSRGYIEMNKMMALDIIRHMIEEKFNQYVFKTIAMLHNSTVIMCPDHMENNKEEIFKYKELCMDILRERYNNYEHTIDFNAIISIFLDLNDFFSETCSYKERRIINENYNIYLTFYQMVSKRYRQFLDYKNSGRKNEYSVHYETSKNDEKNEYDDCYEASKDDNDKRNDDCCCRCKHDHDDESYSCKRRYDTRRCRNRHSQLMECNDHDFSHIRSLTFYNPGIVQKRTSKKDNECKDQSGMTQSEKKDLKSEMEDAIEKISRINYSRQRKDLTYRVRSLIKDLSTGDDVRNSWEWFKNAYDSYLK